MRFLAVAASLLTAASAAAQAPHAAQHAATSGASRTGPPAAAGLPRGVHAVTITARDFAFEAPDTIPAGRTAFRLVNRGPELHHVQLLRLEAGKTMGDFHAAMQKGGPPPAWMRDMGGPNAASPGGENSAIVDVSPGRYVIACVIPSADGTPHLAKGMVRELIVTASARATPAPRPAATAVRTTLSLSDYTFAFSRPLAVGTQTVRVRNDASQSHEVVIVRLANGKSAEDFLAWSRKMDGPPPVTLVGGVTGLASGESNEISVAIEPGEYVLVCFVPDARDGKSHVSHGMVKQISVAAAGARRANATSR